MILQKTVTLDRNRTATVYELTVAEVRQLLSEHCGLQQAPTLELLTDRHGEAKAMLATAIQLPDGEVLDDLPLSEWMAVHQAFVDLNQTLFQLAAARDQAAATQDRRSDSLINPAQD